MSHREPVGVLSSYRPKYGPYHISVHCCAGSGRVMESPAAKSAGARCGVQGTLVDGYIETQSTEPQNKRQH
jgi:hypothetical protein